MSEPERSPEGGSSLANAPLWLAVLTAAELLNVSLQMAAKAGIHTRVAVILVVDGAGPVASVTIEHVN